MNLEINTFNIIGAGSLGKNIALATSSVALLLSICNLSMSSAKQSSEALNAGTAIDELHHLPKADLTWITCSDDAIESVVKNLAQQSLIKPKSLVLHCSGVLSSSVLKPLKEQGCFTASFHPLKAFKQGYLNPHAFNEVDCVLEGDNEACAWLEATFSRLGANLITINPQAKASYHAAACIASNYLITLASWSEQLFLKSGIEPGQAAQLVCKLMQGNLHNMQDSHPLIESLTGPIKRGDFQTLALHLEALDDPLLQKVYKSLGLATLNSISLPEEKNQAIKDLLEF